MKKLTILSFTLFLFHPCFGIVINEVMPNPENPCNEWIEIYNPENMTLNLSEWKINDYSSTYNITCAFENCSLMTNSTYFVVIWKRANITQITNKSTYFIAKGRGNYWLSNSGENLIFYNSTYFTNFTYYSSEKGKSWARFPDGKNWTLCKNPTPGKENNCTEMFWEDTKEETIELHFYIEGEIFLGVRYNKLFRLEVKNKENCSAKTNVTVTYLIIKQNRTIKNDAFSGEIGCSRYANTGNWTPREEGNYTLCGKIINSTTNFANKTICRNITVLNPSKVPCNLSIDLSTPLISDAGRKMTYYIFVNSSLSLPVEVRYWIEDYFGNYMKKPYATKSIKPNKNTSRDYTPKLDCGTEAYKIKAEITKTYCNDTNDKDNKAEKTIVVLAERECKPKIIEKIIYRDRSAGSKYQSAGHMQSQKSGLKLKIINLTKEIAIGEEFTTIIGLKNNFNKEISFEIYSYAFAGRKCITGGWTSNKKEIHLKKNEEKIIELENRIERDASPGNYSFRVRAKMGRKNIDKTGNILVRKEIVREAAYIKEIREPKLEIWSDTKLRINLSNCKECRMIITGPNLTAITSRNYRVFSNFGNYKIFVIKDTPVIINKSYLWEENKAKIEGIENIGENKMKSNTSKIAGKVYEKNITDKFIKGLQDIFSFLFHMMENSIK